MVETVTQIIRETVEVSVPGPQGTPGDASALGGMFAAAPSKTTPVDADDIPISNSAAGDVLYRVTWANIKATLKTYFDTLYQPLNAVLTATTASFTTTLLSKLNGIETAADVTDTANVGTAIGTGGAKTTSVAADLIAILDSAASNALKYISQSNFIASNAATQGQMEAGVATGQFVVPGRMQFHPGVCKAWILYDQSVSVPVIRGSYNVTSLTDGGVGIADVVIGTDMSTAGMNCPFAYAGRAGVRMGCDSGGSGLVQSGAFRIITSVPSSGTLTDCSHVSGGCFGDQA